MIDDGDAVERMRASKEAYEDQQRQIGHAAGVVFANHRADYKDLLILREVASSDLDLDELLTTLFNEYSSRRDFDAQDFNRHLFGNENVPEPSEFFIEAFIHYALQKMEFIAEQADAA